MIPNMQAIVEQTRAAYPRAWEHCHHAGDPEAWDFIILAARQMFDQNQTFGLNGKRGNANDLSWDAVNWKGDHDDPPNVIDCVAGAGGANPQPSWQVTNTTGAWVHPYSHTTHYNYASGGGGGPVPPEPEPQPPAGLTPAEVQAMIDASIAAALVNVPQYGQRIGLQAATGSMKVLCHENGGPAGDHEAYTLTSRSAVGPWESWVVQRGTP